MPKIKTKRDEYLDNDEVLRTIRECNNHQVRAVIVLLWLTGARISEILTLKGRDVEVIEKENALKIKMPTMKRRSKSGIRDKRVLKIPTDNQFFPYFKYYFNNRDPPITEESNIFSYSRQWIWEKIKEANPNVYPHFFRHSFYTKMGEKVDAFTLKAHAGWKKLETANEYVHPKDASNTVFKLEQENLKSDSEKEEN